MHIELIVKTISTHFLLSVHEQAAIPIDKIFFLIFSLFASMRDYDGGNTVGISVISKTLSVNDFS